MILALAAQVALADPLVAVVVVDQEARDAGYALELDELVVDDALPLDVAVGEHVRLLDPQGGTHPLDVAPGEAWTVSGPKGEAWMSTLGTDVRTDVIEVRGSSDAVRGLADALGAEIRVEHGHVWLGRPGVLFDAPWADADTTDVDEVRFVPVDPASTVQDAPSPRPVMPVAVGPVATSPASPVPPVAETSSARDVATETTDGTSIADVLRFAGDQGPVNEPAEAPAGDPREDLDPMRYVGLHLCGDGHVLLLSPEGSFSASGASGTWRVTAPGVVRLEVGGQVWARAGIDHQNHCRAMG